MYYGDTECCIYSERGSNCWLRMYYSDTECCIYSERGFNCWLRMYYGDTECFIYSEPGYYEENNFGIRIESLLIVKKATPKVYIYWLLRRR
jgi:hypothetical protein